MQAASEWLYVVPWGLRKVLNYIAKTYNNPPIYVTENGMCINFSVEVIIIIGLQFQFLNRINEK